MKLIKCPSCKNIVGTDSYCCPRCGKSFRSMRAKRVLLVLLGLLAVVWVAHRFFAMPVPWL